jgi:hypothetical protein
VDLLSALAQVAVATVLMAVVDEALALALLTVSCVLLITAAFAGTVAVGTAASVSDVSNSGYIGDGVLDGSSEGGEAGSLSVHFNIQKEEERRLPKAENGEEDSLGEKHFDFLRVLKWF